MFGNALLFLSNPFFNECFRVDASITVKGDFEKLKTVQGYLFNEEGTQLYDFEVPFVDESKNDIFGRSLAIYDSVVDNVQHQLLDVVFSSVEICNYVREVLKYLDGLRTTANLSSIYTIYFD